MYKTNDFVNWKDCDFLNNHGYTAGNKDIYLSNGQIFYDCWDSAILKHIIYSSTDFENWNKVLELPTGSIVQGITFYKGNYIILTTNNYKAFTFISNDLAKWTPNKILDITVGRASIFVYKQKIHLCYSNNEMISIDGVTFTECKNKIYEDVNLEDLNLNYLAYNYLNFGDDAIIGIENSSPLLFSKSENVWEKTCEFTAIPKYDSRPYFIQNDNMIGLDRWGGTSNASAYYSYNGFDWIKDDNNAIYKSMSSDSTAKWNADTKFAFEVCQKIKDQDPKFYQDTYKVVKENDFYIAYSPTSKPERDYYVSIPSTVYVLDQDFTIINKNVLNFKQIEVLYGDVYASPSYYLDDDKQWQPLTLGEGYLKDLMYNDKNNVIATFNQPYKSEKPEEIHVVHNKNEWNNVSFESDIPLNISEEGIRTIGGYYSYIKDKKIYLSYDGVYWISLYLPIVEEKYSYPHWTKDFLILQFGNTLLSYSKADINEQLNSMVPNGAIYVQLNGELLGFDTPPVIENDRTLVPLRFLFEKMGAKVDWDDNTRTATITKDGKIISLSIDNNIANIDATKYKMDVPARLVNDKTMLPLRFISEALGYNIKWDDIINTVIIAEQ